MDSFTPPWRINIFHHCNFFATFLLPTRGLFPSSPILPFEPFFDFFECRTCLNSPSIKPWKCFTWCLRGTLLTVDFFTFWIPLLSWCSIFFKGFHMEFFFLWPTRAWPISSSSSSSSSWWWWWWWWWKISPSLFLNFLNRPIYFFGSSYGLIWIF